MGNLGEISANQNSRQGRSNQCKMGVRVRGVVQISWCQEQLNDERVNFGGLAQPSLYLWKMTLITWLHHVCSVHSHRLIGWLTTGLVRDTGQILRYLIIHWKYEIGVSKGALLEEQLVISIEALNSKYQANTLHCITTIASAGNIYASLVFEKLLKEIQSALPGFSAKLTWISAEGSYSQDISRVDEKSKTLMTDCLVIKHFLRKIIMVHPKIRFNFSVKVNGIISTEIFEMENEPTLNLLNGIALVVNYQHYWRPKFSTTKSHCDRIHPVLGHPVTLCIPDDVAGLDLLEGLILTPAAALCPNPKVFCNQLNRISSISIFLYRPLGLPLIFSSREQPITTFFRENSYFSDWKKYRLYMVPNFDLNLERDLVLPDVSYQVQPSEEDQSQNMDSQEQTLLLFLFVDFHSGFLFQQVEIWGVHTLLTTHLSAILMKSHSVVRDSIQFTVDQVLEQHHEATKAHQKLQASLSVAVNSIMNIVTGSTSSSFRKMCLKTLEAADTQEFGTKLHKVFHEITQHRFFHHCSCEVKEQLTTDRKDLAQSAEDAHKSSSPELFAESSGQAEKRLKSGSLPQGVDEGQPLQSAGAQKPSEAAPHHPEPVAVPLPTGRRVCEAHGRAPGGESSGSRLEDALWLQEVANLSEWLSPGPGP